MWLFILGILFGWLLEWVLYKLYFEEKFARRESDTATTNHTSAPKQSTPSSAELDAATRAQIDQSAQLNQSIRTPLSDASKKTIDPSEAKALADKVGLMSESVAHETDASVSLSSQETQARSQFINADGDDNLSNLVGISGGMALALKDLGIDSFSKLADHSKEDLYGLLNNAGYELDNSRAIGAWKTQALLAKNNQWTELNRLQKRMLNIQ